MPKIPKIGCFGIILAVLGLLVVGIVFLSVPAPSVHLKPGNIFTADTPEHYWDGEAELHVHPLAEDIEDAIKESEAAGHHGAVHFGAELGKVGELPEHGTYEWVFYVDEEEVGRMPAEHGSEVVFTFPKEGKYTAQVNLWEGEIGDGEAYARAMTHMQEESAFPITNTSVSTFLTVIVLLCLFGFGLRKMNMVPGRFQALCEAIIEFLLNFVEGAAGRENGRKFFAIFATIFLFVITNAWLALVPIFNCIGWGHTHPYDTLIMGTKEGFIVTTTLFRSANTDANLPLAVALVSFVAVEFWGFSALGFRGYMGKFIKFGALINGVKHGPMGILIGFIDFIVGIIEFVLEFVRIVSFTFRLFGNMTAGEVLLMVMFFMVPMWVPIMFYGLEFLVGFIQAIVFAGLTLGFAMIAVAPHEHEEEH